jgi:hypothetical protein
MPNGERDGCCNAGPHSGPIDVYENLRNSYERFRVFFLLVCKVKGKRRAWEDELSWEMESCSKLLYLQSWSALAA